MSQNRQPALSGLFITFCLVPINRSSRQFLESESGHRRKGNNVPSLRLAVTRPSFHQDAPLIEGIAAAVSGFHRVANRMGEGRLSPSISLRSLIFAERDHCCRRCCQGDHGTGGKLVHRIHHVRRVMFFDHGG